MAVGHDFAARPRAIVESWNGRAWHIRTMRRHGTAFLGVSCSRARACTAVGYEQGNATRPLAAAWNGKRWRVRVAPLPRGAPAGMFEAVSCTARRRCTATGTDFGTRAPALAERWNGRTWHIQRTPSPPNYRNSVGEVALDGVSCTSARACAASGDYSPGGAAAYFIEAWNGRRWRLEPTPRPAGFMRGALLAMSCASARCTAVGAYTGPVRLQVTLAMAG